MFPKKEEGCQGVAPWQNTQHAQRLVFSCYREGGTLVSSKVLLSFQICSSFLANKHASAVSKVILNC